VNYTLSLLMWLILGWAVLGILTGGRPSPLQSIFDRFTIPVFGLTRRVLPIVSEKWAPLAALVLLGFGRLLLVILTHPASRR
jgi:hypothetical protein